MLKNDLSTNLMRKQFPESQHIILKVKEFLMFWFKILETESHIIGDFLPSSPIDLHIRKKKKRNGRLCFHSPSSPTPNLWNVCRSSKVFPSSDLTGYLLLAAQSTPCIILVTGTLFQVQALWSFLVLVLLEIFSPCKKLGRLSRALCYQHLPETWAAISQDVFNNVWKGQWSRTHQARSQRTEALFLMPSFIDTLHISSD